MEHLLKRVGALAATIVSVVSVYFVFIQPSLLTVTLGPVIGDKLKSAEVRLFFSNEGRTSLQVAGIELFFTDASDCTGLPLSQKLLQIEDEEMPGLMAAGSKTALFTTLNLDLKNEVRYAFCGSFDIFIGTKIEHKKRVILTEITTMWNEFDRPNLKPNTIELVRTRGFGWF